MSDADRIPVILDTDIGSDIDDAVCLAYLLAQPACELLGVTTVSGQPEVRAMLTDAVCKAAGREEVPIHAGVGPPMLIEQPQKTVAQEKALAQWPHREDFAPNTAVEFLRETIRSRPGEITLLTIGPLTNIGLLFASDPEIPGLLKEVVSMCGWVGGRPEWNALCDPHAAAIVYNRAPLARHTSVTINVTGQCRMPVPEVRAKFDAAGGPLAVVSTFAGAWADHVGEAQPITFHDPLAGALIFQPDLCQYKDGTVEIEHTSARAGGMMYFDRTEPGHDHVALEVDADRFFEHYFTTVGAG